jgi:hypothetical protein
MSEAVQFELEDQLAIVTIKTLNVLYSEENGADAVALYFFYYKTAKSQKTNQIWATREYCRKNLHWSSDRFRGARDTLEKYNLIETIKGSGVNDKWYIKIKYLHSTKPKIEDDLPKTPSKTTPIEDDLPRSTNALSKLNNTNALSKLIDDDEKTAISLKGKKSKYPKLEDITPEVQEAIALKFNVPLNFVIFQFEKLKAYIPNRTKKPYKDYRSALENFVLGSMERQMERRIPDATKRGVDATQL